MTHKSTCAGWIVVIALALLLAADVMNQSTDGNEINTLPRAAKTVASLTLQQAEKTTSILGVDECIRCHLAGLTEPKETPPLFEGFASNVDRWIRYDEIKIWSTSDKHSQAYSVLLADQSKKMGRLLGVQQIHRDQRCLACHSSYPLRDMNPDKEGLVSEKLTHDRKLTLGVSCEGCHGNAEKWYEPHLNKTWRTQSAERKTKEYGYYNIHSPLARAELCASCHIGSVKQGRIVTHEMYAAGHPPLGAFEIESYLDQMPLHWNRFESKNQKLRDEFIKQTGLKYDPNDLHRTKSLLLGAVVSFRESMKLTADLADETINAPIAKPPWPELAQFACFACHHDLKMDGWRQNRTTAVTPGRPVLHEWPTALLQIAIQQTAGDFKEFHDRHEAVTNVFSDRPFGLQAKLNTPLRDVISFMDQVAGKLVSAKLNHDTGRQILQKLVEIGATQTLDYDAARQIAWSFRVVFNDYKSTPQGASGKHNDKIHRIGEQLEQHLTLTFSKKRDKKLNHIFPKESTGRQYGEIPLDQTLPKIADYDPQTVKKHFANIQTLLKNQ